MLKRKPRNQNSIIEALYEAQKIAFSPFVFQACVAAKRLGVLVAMAEPAAENSIARSTGLSAYAVAVLVDALVAAGVCRRDEKGNLQLTKTGECLVFDEMTAVNLDFAADVCYGALEALEEADIPVINLDTEVKDADYITAFVGSDNRNAGYVCGENLIEKKPDGGRIVIVESSSVNSVIERITGFEEAISNAGFEVVQRIDAGGDMSAVKSAVAEIIQSGEQIDAIMCGNDQMAEQVLAALSEAGNSDPLVYSVDGSPVTKSALMDPGSPMEGIGAQSPINMGKTAVKVATAVLNGTAFDRETYEETFFINRDNVEMYGTDGWQ